MSLPTIAAPPATPAAPVYKPIDPDRMNVSDLDSLIGEMNTPKEVILNTPAPGSHDVTTGPGYEDLAPSFNGLEPLPPTITPEEAARTGQRIAEMVNTGLGFGAQMYAKGDDRKDYEADKTDVQQLSRCWADVAMKYSFKVEDSPWVNLILMMAVIYFPIFMKAKADRAVAIFREEMAEAARRQEAVNAKIRADIAALQEEKTAV